jgi:hypothetical protein
VTIFLIQDRYITGDININIYMFLTYVLVTKIQIHSIL